jgi:hypothetical protein
MGHRRHWGIGVEAMETVFKDCPEYLLVRKILEDTFQEVTGKSLRQHAAPMAQLSREIDGLANLNADEARFRDKPERRFYSVDMSKIRQSMIDEVIRTVPPAEIEQLMSRFINPNIRNM